MGCRISPAAAATKPDPETPAQSQTSDVTGPGTAHNPTAVTAAAPTGPADVTVVVRAGDTHAGGGSNAAAAGAPGDAEAAAAARAALSAGGSAVVAAVESGGAAIAAMSARGAAAAAAAATEALSPVAIEESRIAALNAWRLGVVAAGSVVRTVRPRSE
jgi:hypothetical protein